MEVDLSKVVPQIALPFHPSNVYNLQDVIDNPMDILSAVEKKCNDLLNNKKINFKLTDKIVDGKSESRARYYRRLRRRYV